MILLAILLAAAPTDPDKVVRFDQIVEVDGLRLHVKVKGPNVTVAPRKPLGARTMQSIDRARRAVTMVTGCKLVDNFWLNPYYNGIGGGLDCSAAPATP